MMADADTLTRNERQPRLSLQVYHMSAPRYFPLLPGVTDSAQHWQNNTWHYHLPLSLGPLFQRWCVVVSGISSGGKKARGPVIRGSSTLQALICDKDPGRAQSYLWWKYQIFFPQAAGSSGRVGSRASCPAKAAWTQICWVSAGLGDEDRSAIPARGLVLISPPPCVSLIKSETDSVVLTPDVTRYLVN